MDGIGKVVQIDESLFRGKRNTIVVDCSLVMIIIMLLRKIQVHRPVMNPTMIMLVHNRIIIPTMDDGSKVKNRNIQIATAHLFICLVLLRLAML